MAKRKRINSKYCLPCKVVPTADFFVFAAFFRLVLVDDVEICVLSDTYATRTFLVCVCACLYTIARTLELIKKH